MSERLQRSIVIKASDELFASLNQRAVEAGLSRSEYMRIILSLPIVLAPCGKKARRRARNYALDQNFLSGKSRRCPTDFDSADDSNHDEAALLSACYTPAEGVATELAKLNLRAGSSFPNSIHRRGPGRLKVGEPVDRYSIKVEKVLYLTPEDLDDLRVALDRWGTNLNQATRALNTIAKIFSGDTDIDDDAAEFINGNIDDARGLLEETIKGFRPIAERVSKLINASQFRRRI